MWPLVVGAIASAAGSYLNAKNASKGKWEYDPYGQLNPEQKSVMQTMGPQINSKIAAGPQTYQGQLTAPWTAGEQTGLDQWRTSYAKALQGLDPLLTGKIDENYWQKAQVDPMMKIQKEQVDPALAEAWSGPGNTYYGSARANAVQKSYTDLTDTLAAKRAELQHEAMYAPLTAGPVAAGLATTGQALEAAPRLVQQYDLTAKYNEWVRGNNEYKSYLDTALNFLGVSSVSAQYQEAPPNPWAYALQAAGGLASSYGMSGAGGGGTSTQFTGGFDPSMLPSAGSAGYGAIANSMPGAMNVPSNFNFSSTMAPAAQSGWMTEWDKYLQSQKNALNFGRGY